MFPLSVSRLHRPGMASPSGSQGPPRSKHQNRDRGRRGHMVTCTPRSTGGRRPRPLPPPSLALPAPVAHRPNPAGRRGAGGLVVPRPPSPAAGSPGALSGVGRRRGGWTAPCGLYTQRVGRKGPPPRPDVCRVPACCMGVAAGRRRCAGPTRLLGRVLGDERHFPGRARQKGEQARSHGDFACLASCWLHSIAGL